MTFLLATG